MAKKRRLYALLLSTVFLFYFGSYNFFVHCHELPNGILVHSHPFPNKPHHNEQEILTIDALSDATCQPVQELSVPECAVTELFASVQAEIQQPYKSADTWVTSLRGPPMA